METFLRRAINVLDFSIALFTFICAMIYFSSGKSVFSEFNIYFTVGFYSMRIALFRIVDFMGFILEKYKK